MSDTPDPIDIEDLAGEACPCEDPGPAGDLDQQADEPALGEEN